MLREVYFLYLFKDITTDCNQNKVDYKQNHAVFVTKLSPKPAAHEV